MFCRELPHRVRVVAIPHQVFCDDESVGRPYVRWAFCKRPSVLREALDRLSHLALPWTKE
jgi:N-succinyldiaminopimelate aminotransferase